MTPTSAFEFISFAYWAPPFSTDFARGKGSRPRTNREQPADIVFFFFACRCVSVLDATFLYTEQM